MSDMAECMHSHNRVTKLLYQNPSQGFRYNYKATGLAKVTLCFVQSVSYEISKASVRANSPRETLLWSTRFFNGTNSPSYTLLCRQNF